MPCEIILYPGLHFMGQSLESNWHSLSFCYFKEKSDTFSTPSVGVGDDRGMTNTAISFRISSMDAYTKSSNRTAAVTEIDCHLLLLYSN